MTAKSVRRSTSSPFDRGPTRALRTIRVLVADDHEFVRDGLRFAFHLTEIEITDAADRAAAVRLAHEKSIDVVLLDIGWPDQGSSNRPHGFQVLREILVVKPELPIVIYSMHDRESYKRRSRELGARGYIVKGVPNQTLLEAVRRANCGEEAWFEYS